MEAKNAAALELLLEKEFNRLYDRLKREEEKARALQWGGFFRRASAFSVDIMVLSLLSALLFDLAYVGYSVGLAAHNRWLLPDNLATFLQIFLFGWLLLVAGYFILLNGMAGHTVGTWLLGLRIVGANREPLTYGRALLRWAATVTSALSGLGLLWILFNREKRGWHDLVANTWVIRE